MGLEYVDIFYSHRRDPKTPLEETMGALDFAVRSGRALYAAISSYNAEDTAAAAKILRSLGTPCLIHQPRYSMFDRWIEPGLLDVLGAEGIGGIAFCPLAQGLLTDRYLHGIPDGSRASKPDSFLKKKDIDEGRLIRVRALNSLAAERGQSLAQMALAWVLRDDRMTSALIGASRVEQIEQNVAALSNLAFSAAELAKIDAILKPPA
jgi:L-glyceraldehyde 3-phosphate reductase